MTVFSVLSTLSNSETRNISTNVSIATEPGKDDFRLKLMDIRMKNLNCIAISQINMNSIKNNFEVLSQVSAGKLVNLS